MKILLLSMMAIIFSLTLLSGCGQSGKLYLPEPEKPPAKQQTTEH